MMNKMICLKNIQCDNHGFTLIELIVVFTILSIIVAIVIPGLASYTEQSKEKVCMANCSQLERMYELYLVQEGIEHSKELFNQFLQDYGSNICPSGGYISYIDGKVICSKHSTNSNDSQQNDESVPFL